MATLPRRLPPQPLPLLCLHRLTPILSSHCQTAPVRGVRFGKPPCPPKAISPSSFLYGLIYGHTLPNDAREPTKMGRTTNEGHVGALVKKTCEECHWKEGWIGTLFRRGWILFCATNPTRITATSGFRGRVLRIE